MRRTPRDRNVRSLRVIAVAFGLVACSSEPAGSGLAVDASLDGPASDARVAAGDDTASSDDGATADSRVTAASDATGSGDTAARGATDAAARATDAAGGGAGAACAGDDDCATGACVLARGGGKRCAASCDKTCPTGQRCVYAAAYQTNLCVDAHLSLCDPCSSSIACRHLGGDASACVAWGSAGNFCGSWCAADADCPTDFVCAPGKDVAGLAVKQCRPAAGGVCSCSVSAVESAAKTSCGAGSCLGTRTCTTTGLSACSAPKGSAETCDGADNDCDGVTDEAGAAGCTQTYVDLDGDGHGSGKLGPCLCKSPGVSKGGDCDDTNKTVYPGATEVCDGKDNDCDKAVDEAGATGCKTYYVDADEDGYGGAAKACLCAATGTYSATKGGDCVDSDKAVNPGQAEVCNGKDDNCKGGKDEGGVCAPATPQVCYPGVDNKYTGCYGLVALSTIKDSAYVWPASSASNYKPPVYVLDLTKVSASTKIAKNFVLSEVMSASKGKYGVFSAQTVARLQAVRSQLGTALTVNSGFRSPGHNKGISGAAPLSRHQWGDAADVTTKGKTTLQKIIDVCKANSADYTQLYTTHVHCDWRNDPAGHDFWPKKPAPPPPLTGASPPPPPPATPPPPSPTPGQDAGHADSHAHSPAPRDAAWRAAWQAALWAQPVVIRSLRRGEDRWLELGMTWGRAFDEGTPWVTWTVRSPRLTRRVEPSVHTTVPDDAWVCWEVGAMLSGCAPANALETGAADVSSRPPPSRAQSAHAHSTHAPQPSRRSR